MGAKIGVKIVVNAIFKNIKNKNFVGQRQEVATYCQSDFKISW